MPIIKIEIDYHKILCDVHHTQLSHGKNEVQVADEICGKCVEMLLSTAIKYDLTLIKERNPETGQSYFYFESNYENKNKILQIPYVHEVI